MKRKVVAWVRFFVFSNLFIAFCTAAFTIKTSLLLYGNYGSLHVNILVFSSTLLFYCFHRINKKNFLSPLENQEDRNIFMSGHKTLYYILIALSSLTLAFTLFYMPLRTWCVFICVGILGIAYTFPIIPTSKGWKRLRDIYWLKTFWIALAFSIFTTFLPVLYFQPISSILKPPVLFTFFRALLFIFSICIPFDIRDIHFDKLKQVRTLPVILGPTTSIYIAITVLLIFISLICIQLLYFNLNLRLASALFASALITILLLLFSKRKRPALLYPLLYDGSMLFQCILIIAFTYI